MNLRLYDACIVLCDLSLCCLDMQMQCSRREIPCQCLWVLVAMKEVAALHLFAVDQQCFCQILEISWHDFLFPTKPSVSACHRFLCQTSFVSDVWHSLGMLPVWTLTLDACWLLLFRMPGDARLLVHDMTTTIMALKHLTGCHSFELIYFKF